MVSETTSHSVKVVVEKKDKTDLQSKICGEDPKFDGDPTSSEFVSCGGDPTKKGACPHQKSPPAS